MITLDLSKSAISEVSSHLVEVIIDDPMLQIDTHYYLWVYYAGEALKKYHEENIIKGYSYQTSLL